VSARVGSDVLVKLNARMTAIPAGQAKSQSRGGKPVTIAGFFLGKYEVTRGEWSAVMGGNSGSAGDDLPATGVSFLDVRKFLDRLNEAAGAGVYRLPTRREWEYACHAGRAGKYPWGNDENAIGRHAWWGKNSDEHPHGVGGKLPNAWGLFDMIGNVDEWTSDVMKGGLIYVEGGNFDELNASGLLCENESGVGEDGRTDYNGFRLAREAKKK
jgi:formylglycine-generating enzyme required for sulfatase activity